MRIVMVLLVILVASALSVEYTIHRWRMLNDDKNRISQELEAFDMELGNSRIEKMAHGRLGMGMPQRDSIIYTKP